MKNERLRGLSLFSGVAGIEIGLQEWVETEAYCEIDKYAQAVLKSRFGKDIQLYEDITELHCKQNEFDIITGGFPCQDISNAGKRRGIKAERSGLWFEMQRLIGEVRPRYVFAENVSALINRGLPEVLASLAEIGYDAIWTTLRASDVGAPHRRERVFMLAYPDSERWDSRECAEREYANIPAQIGQTSQGEQSGSGWFGRIGEVCEGDVSNTLQERYRGWEARCETDGVGSMAEGEQDNGNSIRSEVKGCDRDRGREEDVAYPTGNGCLAEQHQAGELGETLRQAPAGQPCGTAGPQGASWWAIDPADLPDPTKQGLEGQEPAGELPGRQPGCFAECSDGKVEPRLGGVVNGLSERLDTCGYGYTPRVTSETAWRVERLKCLGNGCVPQQAREAFIRLIKIKTRLEDEKD